MIRKIMVPVRGDGKGDNVLRHAAALAHAHKAHIEITHCRPRPEDLMPYGVPIPEFLREQIRKQTYEVADMEEQGLRDELTALAADLDLQQVDKPTGARATVSFIEEVGRQVDVIKRHGRLADLIAVPQPDRDRVIGTNTLQTALFSSGRPVLMCPPADAAPASLGKTVALAWNGSTEAARALSQSLPVIHKAETVSILTNGSDNGPGTTAEDVVDYLKAHDADAQIVRFEAKKRGVGAALLDKAAEIGADMVIMGAYGDSHERETLFGGTASERPQKM